MTTIYTDIAQMVRECGSDFLLCREAGNSLFPTAVATRSESLLGHQIMGEPRKCDSAAIRFTAVEPSKGLALGVATNARAHEIDKPGLATTTYGAIVTKETCSFDHETLTAIHSANAGCASDAQLEAIARSVLTAFDTLADRFTGLLEKAFWDGALGQMTITMDNSNAPLTVNTGTTQLAALAGSDVWTDTVNASPLEDLDQMKMAFRGTGFKPCKVAMNAATYEYFANAESVKAALGDCLCAVAVQGMALQTVRGVELNVYDGGYCDVNGSFVPYIPDGYVVMLGCGACPGVQRFDCINVDDCAGITYGSYTEVLKDKNPMQKAAYHSYVGAPVFSSPGSVVGLQVF